MSAALTEGVAGAAPVHAPRTGREGEAAAPLLFERDGEVAVLTLAEPARLNPLTEPLQRALRERLAQLREDRSVRAVVLTGAGRAFCVGADLASMGAQGAGGPGVPAAPSLGGGREAPGTPAGPSLGERTERTMEALSNRLIEDLRTLPVPVVSAVNGPAAGAGVGVALAADVVLAARSAYFYLPFLPRLGIVPDLGTTWFLERLLGRARATGLALLGDRLGAEQAAQWGLIWACVDDAALRGEAMGIARRLACGPAHAVPELRAALEAAGRNTLVEQMRLEAARQRELIDRPEFAEGVRAFLEKREPRFPAR